MLSYLRMAPWLAILILIGVVAAQGSRIHKFHEQTIKLSEQLRSITTAKDTQKQTTGENIKVVHQITRVADDKAQVIEQAPVPPDCKTKPEVMGADL